MSTASKNSDEGWTKSQLFKVADFAIKSTSSEILEACLQVLRTTDVAPIEVFREVLSQDRSFTPEAVTVLGPSLGFDLFTQILNHKNWLVRSDYVKVLSHVPGEPITAAIKSVLNDESEMVQHHAANAIKHREDLPAPLKLPEATPTPRQMVIFSLLSGRPLRDEDLVEIPPLVAHPNKALSRLARSYALDPQVRDNLVEYLRDTKHDLSPENIETLAQVGTRAAQQALINFVRRATSAKARRQCFDALASVETFDVLEQLLPIVRHTELDDKMLRSLANILERDETAGRTWLEKLYLSDEIVQRTRGSLLAIVVGESAIPHLIENSTHFFRQIRNSAFDGLVAIGTPSVAALIASLNESPSTGHRQDAAGALLRIARTHSCSVEWPKTTVAVLSKLLREPPTRLTAIELFGCVPDQAAFTSITDSLDLLTPREVRRAIYTCERLVRQLAVIPTECVLKIASLMTVNDSSVGNLVFKFLTDVALSSEHKSQQQVAVLQALSTVATDQRLDGVDSYYRDASIPLLRTIDSLVSDNRLKHESVASLHVKLSEWAKEQKQKTRPVQPRGAQSSGRAYSLDTSSRPPTVSSATDLTVVAPRMIARGQTCLISVWVHEEPVGDILRLAQNSHTDDLLRPQTKFGVDAPLEVPIVVELSIPSLEVDRVIDTLRLARRGGRTRGNCTFRVEVNESHTAGVHFGIANLRLENGMPIAKLDFLIEVGEKASEVCDATCVESRVKTAFASYARADKERVLSKISAIQAVVQELEIFVDVLSLRAGEKWESRLLDEIEKRDMLLLFWSRAAMTSSWVDREWRTALESKGIAGIRPVPLESPDVSPPPMELQALHFSDWVHAASR